MVLLGVSLVAATGCRTSRSQEDQLRLQRELGVKIPLWVELECTKKGKPRFKEYSILKMPDEAINWALAKLDDHCRIYGTLTTKGGRKPDMCDIRFRSRDAVVDTGRCRCVAGRYVLEEGYPTSKRCCKKYPEKVYCKEPVETPPEPPSHDLPPSAEFVE
jgi:hypothetical protein